MQHKIFKSPPITKLFIAGLLLRRSDQSMGNPIVSDRDSDQLARSDRVAYGEPLDRGSGRVRHKFDIENKEIKLRVTVHFVSYPIVRTFLFLAMFGLG